MGVDEFSTPGNLELPVLLSEREGVDGFVGECDAVDGRVIVCGLRLRRRERSVQRDGRGQQPHAAPQLPHGSWTWVVSISLRA